MSSAPIEAPGLTGIVLAGGRSRRMGRDKALLPWRGRDLLHHMLDLLVRAGCDQCLVSGDRPGLPHVPDRIPGRGPLGGLASVLSASPRLYGDLLLIVPVDMPLLRATHLRQLVIVASRAGASAVSFADHALPSVLRNDAGLLPAVHAALEDGGSLRGLLARLDALALPGPDAALTNANTPAQWLRLQERRRQTAGLAENLS